MSHDTDTPKRILLLQGHPDPAGGHLLHTLAGAYAEGARSAGHTVEQIDITQLDFPLLRSQKQWTDEPLPPVLQPAQDAIGRAQHLALFFPLWLGDMPALVKGFLEQVARPGFALKPEEGNPFGAKGLTGRSARVVVTMGMPAALYRVYFRAHSVKSLERNILGFVGIAPVHSTLIGLVDKLGDKGVAKWCAAMRELGVEAA
jgi:putative NADPH-quinone reductase